MHYASPVAIESHSGMTVPCAHATVEVCVVGQNTSCKAQKVCISLWPMGWDDMRTRADESPF